MKKENAILIFIFVFVFFNFVAASDPTPTLSTPTPTKGILPTPTRTAIPTPTLSAPTPSSNFNSGGNTSNSNSSHGSGGTSSTNGKGGPASTLPDTSMPRKDAVIFTVLAVLVLSGTTLYFISRRRMASVRNVGLILMFAGAAGVAIPLVPFTLSVFAGNENSRISVTGSEVKLKEENRLIIPEIGVDMPIAQNENALERGGWVFPDASTPDGGGNTVIFGHRFKYLPPLSNTFYQLDRVKTGDTFSLSWQGKIYNYRITEMKIIRPEDLSVLSREGTARVSLITCTPLFSSKQRLVITGELLN